MSAKSKLILNLTLTLITAGGWLPIWGVWYLLDKGKKSINIAEESKRLQLDIYDLQGAVKHHEAIEKSLSKLENKLPKTGTLLNIPLVRLYESRQGDSTTETTGTLKATTKTGTVGIGTKIGGIGVGVAASQGETRGTINSKSVTRSGKDEMTLIDNGTLVLKANSLSLTGSQFTRSVDLQDLLACSVKRNEILVSSTSSEKNWLLALNSNEAAEIVGEIATFLSENISSKSSATEGSKLLKALSVANSDATQKLRDELGSLEVRLAELESSRQAIS